MITTSIVIGVTYVGTLVAAYKYNKKREEKKKILLNI